MRKFKTVPLKSSIEIKKYNSLLIDQIVSQQKVTEEQMTTLEKLL